MSTDVTLVERNDGVAIAEWGSLANGETGDRVNLGKYPGLKTFQLEGTFGGATVAIQGSMEPTPTNWHDLSTVELAAGIYVLLTGLSAAQMSSIIANPLWIRVVLTGGDGTTDLKVIIGCTAKSK